jgi:hypothetical protein
LSRRGQLIRLRHPGEFYHVLNPLTQLLLHLLVLGHFLLHVGRWHCKFIF